MTSAVTATAYIVDGVRTPFGRYQGMLAALRTEDLGTAPIRALIERNSSVDWDRLEDVLYGCAYPAHGDSRNIARACALQAGLPVAVAAATINRLGGSGLGAVARAARTITTGQADLVIAGGVESMSRAPLPGAGEDEAHLQAAENLAASFCVSRRDQDAFALRSRQQ